MKNIFIFMTKNLGVRLCTQGDVEKLFELTQHDNGREVLKDKLDTIDDVKKYIEMSADSDRMKHYPMRYVIVRKEDGVFVGHVCYKRNSERTIQLIITIGDDFRKNGYASEVLDGAVKYGKEHLKLPQIYCIVLKENEVARHIMEKHGFTFVEEYAAEWHGETNTFERYRI